MRTLNYILVGIAFLVYVMIFRGEGMKAVIFFLPFTMSPFLVHLGLAKKWRAFGSQAVLVVATMAYATWFIYVYLSVTVWHPDPQGPIAFLFVGIYAAPVLLVLWWISYALEWESRKSD